MSRIGRVVLSNLEKVLYPELALTKKEIIEYYIRIAPKMLPFLSGRPVILNRFPDGIDHQGFFEKNAPRETPDWVTLSAHRSGHTGKVVRYIVCDRLDTLIWLANLAAIELNITLSPANEPEMPDFALFDIDPEPPFGIQEAVRVTAELRDVLEGLGIRGYVKTSGKKGLHVVVPLKEGYNFNEVRNFVHATGILLSREHEWIVSEFPRSRDPGTVFVDYLQNTSWKTMACPYSLRPVPAASVSCPISWDEVSASLKPEDFNIATVISRTIDPWNGIFDDRQDIPVK
ncbi:bifunctional non-homologous end joining protein LigD [Methanolinea mesophila]|uniref:non-homologous end-joining DNA ligase n=1 Tax=Methanolinea mesophila TaxID=547055 RepID=UPI001AE6119D|nr:non-homologous end-joining DNA ligase [Methanolinea mesophila]MBP1927977.1 bifunctional non-homologous end joining protein LigD [Methanolinea mesophila]